MSSDAVAVSAVEVARAALNEAADASTIGDYIKCVDEGFGIASHLFECSKAGYRGWYWTVSVSELPDSSHVTINDVLLLPGDESILAPAWTPYKERIQPGDLSPGDLLPPEPDDPRLVPAWSAGDEDDSEVNREAAKELAGGRGVVLSLEGREQAADRWWSGDQGPDTPIAEQAPGTCRTCGFLVRMAGPMSLNFGVCANGMANADGRVVAYSHGCGAHSGAKLAKSSAPQPLPDPVFDTVAVDEVDPFEVD